MAGIRDQAGDSLRAFRDVFRNPGLRRVELAFAGSELGDWGWTIALAVYAYGAGGAAAVGVLGLIKTLPAAVAAPFASFFADRFRRERVMFATDLARAAALVGATVAVVTHAPAG
ncbi:MAG: hypothetical protein E6G67_11245, partial [Actinobacteria bacterium]